MQLASSRIIEELDKDYEEGRLPQSILFAGSRNSGRLTEALNLAFRINGNPEGRRTLDADNIVYVPQRNLLLPLKASYKLLEQHPCDRYKYFFIESCRLVLMQYHPALQSQGKDKSDKIFEKAGEADELLQTLSALDVTDGRFQRLADEVYGIVSKDEFASKGRRKVGLNVDDVRAIQNYVNLGEKNKFIILENIENSNDSIKNALLKVLEEPPKGTYFILISDNMQKMMQTILSRVRKYVFPSPSKVHLNACLKERFLTIRDYEDMDEFFYEASLSEEERADMDELCSRYLGYLVEAVNPDVRILNDMFTRIEKENGMDYFLMKVIRALENLFVEGGMESYKIGRMLSFLRQARINMDVYNQNLKVALDLVLREVASCR